MTPEGKVRQVIDISASQGHIVPTSLVATEGVLYVGNLNLFPIDPHWAKVMTIAKNVYVPNPLPGFGSLFGGFGQWNIVSSKAGFTTIVSMKIGPDGLLYVLELSDFAANGPTQGKGKVVRVKRSGDIEDVVTGYRADGHDLRAGRAAVCVEPGRCRGVCGTDPADRSASSAVGRRLANIPPVTVSCNGSDVLRTSITYRGPVPSAIVGTSLTHLEVVNRPPLF